MKEVLKDIWRNYKVPLILAAILETVLIIVNYNDPIEPFWFWLSTIICTGVYPACVIYGIIKLRGK